MACRIFHKCLQNVVSPKTLTFSVLRTWHIQSNTYATKPVAKKGAAGAPSKKKQLEVEEDPKILCTTLCGGNILKEGEDPVLGPDEDYPDWLWNLRTTSEAVPLEELDKDDIRYWRRLRKLTIRQKNALRHTEKL